MREFNQVKPVGGLQDKRGSSDKTRHKKEVNKRWKQK